MENEIVVIERQSTDVVNRVEELVVKNEEQYNSGAELLITIKGIKKKINEIFDDGILKVHEAHKAAIATKAKFSNPVESARKVVSLKLSEYLAKEETKRLEKERKLQADAEKKEAELREKARLSEEAGKDNQAEKYEAKADAVIPAPKVETKTQAMSGVQRRTVWSAVVTDKSKLPPEYLEPKMSVLNAIAKATKGVSTIPGVKFVSESKVI